LREHSIGFNYVSDKIKFVEDTTYSPEGHYEISEVKLGRFQVLLLEQMSSLQ